MLVIAIKNLEMYFSNTNLFLAKNAICFKPLAQKQEIGKQTINVLY